MRAADAKAKQLDAPARGVRPIPHEEERDAERVDGMPRASAPLSLTEEQIERYEAAIARHVQWLKQHGHLAS